MGEGFNKTFYFIDWKRQKIIAFENSNFKVILRVNNALLQRKPVAQGFVIYFKIIYYYFTITYVLCGFVRVYKRA